MKRCIPCIVVAGTHSGVGKTSVATALMSACVRRGSRVQGFKGGPDFIDPGFHRVATGRPSYNLDGWMLSRETNLAQYSRAAHDADICIVEGVMGLFDGRSAETEQGSTAEMAKWLAAPVLLVIDGSAMARSAAAVVHGFESFDPELRVVAAVFNRVSSESHFAYLSESVLAHCRAKPLGYLARNSSIALPERHLGLHLAHEVLTPELVSRFADWIEEHVDVESILELARTGAATWDTPGQPPSDRKPTVRIGIARDRAFHFYYQANLEQLRQAGAELIEFSPIDDPYLPQQLGALYLGGGYPELYAPALSANRSMRQSIRHFAETGGIIYAECGGFMYLTEAIVDQNNQEHRMCGLFPTRARMHRKLAALGYAELSVPTASGWLPSGLTMRGHEFRYSTIDPMPANVPRTYRVRRGKGDEFIDGYCTGNVIAGYFHVHFGSCPEFVKAFVAAANTANPL